MSHRDALQTAGGEAGTLVKTLTGHCRGRATSLFHHGAINFVEERRRDEKGV